MRLPLATIEVFTAIARHGSQRAAADALGIKPATVSHQLKTLEDQLGTALFIRTTRSLSLTDAGRALYRGAGPAFKQLGEAVESAQSAGHAARGKLRLAMPEFVFSMLVGPLLAGFSQEYPEIEVELRLTDALSDILDEELHAGFRLGDRIAQDMVAVRVSAALPLAVAACPDYLQAHGHPQHPRELQAHQCIRYRFQSSGRFAPWDFCDGDQEFRVDVQGKFITNTIPTSLDLAKAGLGLVYTFERYVQEDFSAGVLKQVLIDYLPKTPSIFIYFPREYRAMVPLRCLLNYLKQEL